MLLEIGYSVAFILKAWSRFILLNNTFLVSLCVQIKLVLVVIIIRSKRIYSIKNV